MQLRGRDQRWPAAARLQLRRRRALAGVDRLGQVKNPPRCNVFRGSLELGFEWLPVQLHAFYVIRDCGHDSKIVGTIF
jgi:hypothetical protein